MGRHKMIALETIKEILSSKRKYWISFTGDSITSCEWVHPNWRDIVIYVLQNELIPLMDGDWKTPEWGLKGFNFAYDGSSTEDVVERLGDILLVKPDLVIGLMGGNDPVLGVNVEKSVENIKTIYEKVKSTGASVIWSNSTPAGKGSKKNEEYKPYADAFMSMIADTDLIKIDMFRIYQTFPTEKFYTFISEENPVEGIKAGEIDLQHPNQLGNAYIAKVILKEGFGVEFDPEKYIRTTLSGDKYPSY